MSKSNSENLDSLTNWVDRGYANTIIQRAHYEDTVINLVFPTDTQANDGEVRFGAIALVKVLRRPNFYDAPLTVDIYGGGLALQLPQVSYQLIVNTQPRIAVLLHSSA